MSVFLFLFFLVLFLAPLIFVYGLIVGLMHLLLRVWYDLLMLLFLNPGHIIYLFLRFLKKLWTALAVSQVAT